MPLPDTAWQHVEAGGRLGSDQPGINGNACLSQVLLTPNVFCAPKHNKIIYSGPYFHQWGKKQVRNIFQMPAATGGPSLLLFCVLKGGLLQSLASCPKPTFGLALLQQQEATLQSDALAELMVSAVPLAQMHSSYPAPWSSQDAWLSLCHCWASKAQDTNSCLCHSPSKTSQDLQKHGRSSLQE